MDDASLFDELFFTDKQLCERWRCSKMQLWRLRHRGLLCPPIKLGGWRNLTPASRVLELERAAKEVSHELNAA